MEASVFERGRLRPQAVSMGRLELFLGRKRLPGVTLLLLPLGNLENFLESGVAEDFFQLRVTF